MGLWNALQSIGHKTLGALKPIGHAVGSAIHGIAGISNQIDTALNFAKDLPIIGELAEKIADNELYQLVQTGITTADELADHFEDRGLIGGFQDIIEGTQTIPPGIFGVGF